MGGAYIPTRAPFTMFVIISIAYLLLDGSTIECYKKNNVEHYGPKNLMLYWRLTLTKSDPLFTIKCAATREIRSSEFPSRFDTNRHVQSQKMARN